MESLAGFLIAYALIPGLLFCWVAYEWYTLRRERRGETRPDERDREQ